MDELTKIRGRHAELKQRYNELDLSAQADIATLRDYLNPYEPDLTKIDVDTSIIVMDRLAKTVREMRSICEQLTKIDKALA